MRLPLRYRVQKKLKRHMELSQQIHRIYGGKKIMEAIGLICFDFIFAIVLSIGLAKKI